MSITNLKFSCTFLAWSRRCSSSPAKEQGGDRIPQASSFEIPLSTTRTSLDLLKRDVPKEDVFQAQGKKGKRSGEPPARQPERTPSRPTRQSPRGESAPSYPQQNDRPERAQPSEQKEGTVDISVWNKNLHYATMRVPPRVPITFISRQDGSTHHLATGPEDTNWPAILIGTPSSTNLSGQTGEEELRKLPQQKGYVQALWPLDRGQYAEGYIKHDSVWSLCKSYTPNCGPHGIGLSGTPRISQ